MASYRCAPTALSGIAVIDGSETSVPRKTASASRCRSGEDGAVNWKTAGAESATLCRGRGMCEWGAGGEEGTLT